MTDVVIAGAGPSGLRLAGILSRAGISVALIEARYRIGGRLLTVESGIDLGATGFWQHETDVIDAIAECGLEFFPQYSSGNMMYQIPGGVQQLDGNPLDQQAWWISGGMQSLANGLARALPNETLKLSTNVTKLEFGDSVLVSADQGQWVARHVALAVPPATALAHWEKSTTSAIKTGIFGALFGFSRGSVGASSVGEDDSGQETVIAQLGELFGPEAGNPRQLLLKNWSDSKFTSPLGVSELNYYQLFGQKFCKNLTLLINYIFRQLKLRPSLQDTFKKRCLRRAKLLTS